VVCPPSCIHTQAAAASPSGPGSVDNECLWVLNSGSEFRTLALAQNACVVPSWCAGAVVQNAWALAAHRLQRRASLAVNLQCSASVVVPPPWWPCCGMMPTQACM
jgi:hypothetical protein